MAITAWALAEFFTRRRRMALPSILLLLAFVAGVFLACTHLLKESDVGYLAASGAAAFAAWLHWKRFHVPITVAAGAGAALGGVFAALLAWNPAARPWLPPLLFLAGVAVFALALRWDASDARRQTRRSDVAFWLHLLAAPLLVHPVFTEIGVFSGQTTLTQTLLVGILYVAIAFVSLAVDRRALMVSALGYVLYAFSTLLQQSGFVSSSFALTALIIGAALLLLSAFWHGTRAFTLRALPPALRNRLAPLQ
jgi:MFS family permease